jgi:hypothetical protein
VWLNSAAYNVAIRRSHTAATPQPHTFQMGLWPRTHSHCSRVYHRLRHSRVSMNARPEVPLGNSPRQFYTTRMRALPSLTTTTPPLPLHARHCRSSLLSHLPALYLQHGHSSCTHTAPTSSHCTQNMHVHSPRISSNSTADTHELPGHITQHSQHTRELTLAHSVYLTFHSQ